MTPPYSFLLWPQNEVTAGSLQRLGDHSNEAQGLSIIPAAPFYVQQEPHLLSMGRMDAYADQFRFWLSPTTVQRLPTCLYPILR